VKSYLLSSKVQTVNDTRDRILETALDLFIERGYDKTSLREVAERVGVTKAALYYHFSSKEEIIRTLVQPLFDHLESLAAVLASEPDLHTWGKGLEAIIEWLLPQRRLFELFENNQATLSALAERSMDIEAHQAFHKSIDAIFANEATPLADRVRMAGSVGVITGVFGGPAGKVFWHVPADELKPLILQAIHDVLGVD
jgi:AcrR family transcriptional regulator